MTITEKIGAEELLLDPTKTVQKCGITVSAITAHSLMVNPEGLGWENFYEWLVKLHLGIKDLQVKAVGDTLDIRWQGTNDVLIYIDSLAGVHPNGTNVHTTVVGRGHHTVEVREIAHEIGLKQEIDVRGTAAAPQVQIKVSDVTTTSFQIEVLNYVEFTAKIGSDARTNLPNPFTVTGLAPETNTSMTFYDRYGNNIGLFTVTTDDVSHETQPPAIPSNQVVTFQENDEVGSMLKTITWDTRGLPIIQAHIDDPVVKEYFTVTSTGHIVPVKDLDFETLPVKWVAVNTTTKEYMSRVAIQTSAGGGANYVKFQITDVSEQAPNIPINQTYDLNENTGTLGQALGTVTINDNGSPITKIELSGPASVYVMIGIDGAMTSTGVKPDFENPVSANQWRSIQPNAGHALRIESDLYITATNANGSVTRKMAFRVVNMPDTKPYIDVTTPLSVTLAENTAVGTFLGRVPVRDDGSAITAATLVNAGVYIAIDNNGNLTANVPADFEALKADATWLADGTDKLYKEGIVSFTNANGTSTAPIKVIITDVADDKPKVTDLTIEVAENTIVGTIVGKVPVEVDVGAPVTAQTLDAPLSEYLSIDPDGTLKLIKSPDFENIPTFILVSGRMIAQSDATFVNKFGSGKGTILMKVTNTADTSAEIVLHQTFSIDEGKPIGTYVGTLAYTVGDNVLEGFIMGSPADDYFQIDAQGNITVKAVPDYEALAPNWQKDPALTISAVNAPVSMKLQGKPNLVQDVSFKINNLADTKPFIQLDQTFGIQENAVINTNLGTLVFNDQGNAIQNAQIEFPANKYFNIDTLGRITTATGIDFEALPANEFTLDGNNKFLITSVSMTNSIGTTSVPLRLQVLDVTDDKPQFVNAKTMLSTFENIPAGTVLGTVAILDMGSPLTAVTIEDAEVNNLLTIDLAGKVKVGIPPDYEALGAWAQPSAGVRSKTVKVKATNDHGSTEADFEIQIKDVNEIQTPTITGFAYSGGQFGAYGYEGQPGTGLLFDDGGSPITSASILSDHAKTMFSIDNTGKLTKLGGYPVLDGSPVTGWTPDYLKTMYRSTIKVRLTNAAGTTDKDIPITILNPPMSRADLLDKAQAKTITGWENTRGITSMEGMFARGMDYNPPMLSKWDVRAVTRFVDFARGNTSFNASLDYWETSSAELWTNAFRDAMAFNKAVSQFDMRKTTSIESMFAGAIKFNKSVGWGLTSSTATFKYVEFAFYNATDFQGYGLEEWDTSNIERFAHMLRNTQVDRNISGWNTHGIDGGHTYARADFHKDSPLQQVNCPPALW